MDRIERIGSSLVQHGPHNRRVYLMKLALDDVPGTVGRLNELAATEGYSELDHLAGGQHDLLRQRCRAV